MKHTSRPPTKQKLSPPWDRLRFGTVGIRPGAAHGLPKPAQGLLGAALLIPELSGRHSLSCPGTCSFCIHLLKKGQMQHSKTPTAERKRSPGHSYSSIFCPSQENFSQNKNKPSKQHKDTQTSKQHPMVSALKSEVSCLVYKRLPTGGVHGLPRAVLELP